MAAGAAVGIQWPPLPMLVLGRSRADGIAWIGTHAPHPVDRLGSLAGVASARKFLGRRTTARRDRPTAPRRKLSSRRGWALAYGHRLRGRSGIPPELSMPATTSHPDRIAFTMTCLQWLRTATVTVHPGENLGLGASIWHVIPCQLGGAGSVNVHRRSGRRGARASATKSSA